MEILNNLMLILGLTLVYLVVYYALKRFVLSKIKINKWIVLVLCILSALIPTIYINITKSDVIPNAVSWISQGLSVVSLLWFMELSGFLKKRDQKLAEMRAEKDSKSGYKPNVKRIKHKKDKNAIVPKAKPNPRRAKKD